jgi:hypothetical protein
MHDSLRVHVLQAFEKTKHELSYLRWSEKTIFKLDFMEELSARE